MPFKIVTLPNGKQKRVSWDEGIPPTEAELDQIFKDAGVTTDVGPRDAAAEIAHLKEVTSKPLAAESQDANRNPLPGIVTMSPGERTKREAVGAVKAVKDMGTGLYSAAKGAVRDPASAVLGLPSALGHMLTGLVTSPVTAGNEIGSGDPETMGRGIVDGVASILGLTGASSAVRAGAGAGGEAVLKAAAKKRAASTVGRTAVDLLPKGSVINKILDHFAPYEPPPIPHGPVPPVRPVPNPNTGGTLVGGGGNYADIVARELQSRLEGLSGDRASSGEWTRITGGPQVAARTAADLEEAAASPARANASTDFVRKSAKPSLNAGGRLVKGTGGGAQTGEAVAQDALDSLLRPESVELPLSHPVGGESTVPPMTAGDQRLTSMKAEDTINEMLKAQTERETEARAAARGTDADVPDNPVAKKLEAERKALARMSDEKLYRKLLDKQNARKILTTDEDATLRRLEPLMKSRASARGMSYAAGGR